MYCLLATAACCSFNRSVITEIVSSYLICSWKLPSSSSLSASSRTNSLMLAVDNMPNSISCLMRPEHTTGTLLPNKNNSGVAITWRGTADYYPGFLPGEPTATWHFFRWVLSWLTGLPPMKTWHSRPSMAQPMAMTTEWICTAISRVGASTRTCRREKCPKWKEQKGLYSIGRRLRMNSKTPELIRLHLFYKTRCTPSLSIILPFHSCFWH